MSCKASKVYLVVAALLLASATVALGSQDPDLRQCRSKCRAQGHSDEKRVRQCLEQCESRSRHDNKSPIQKLRECNKDCERLQEQPQREDCQRDCMERYTSETWRLESESDNPYVFEDRHFSTGMETQHGRLRILHKFTERSDLLRGIENFRIAILEAQPQTFIVPNHLDADTIVFVARGNCKLIWI